MRDVNTIAVVVVMFQTAIKHIASFRAQSLHISQRAHSIRAGLLCSVATAPTSLRAPWYVMLYSLVSAPAQATSEPALPLARRNADPKAQTAAHGCRADLVLRTWCSST